MTPFSLASPARGPLVRLCTLLWVVSFGCASHVPRFPGPLGPVAKVAPPAQVQELPAADPPPPRTPRPRPVVKPTPVAKPAPNPKPKGRSKDLEPRGSKKDGFGSEMAKAATHHLKHSPRGFRNDCSGFVMATYARAGRPASGNTRTFWADAKSEGRVHNRPSPGDLVFFDNTYDRNNNRKRDDDLTHIGVVLTVDGSRLTVAHAGTSKGRALLTMDWKDRSTHRDDSGALVNDYLRGGRDGGPVFAGQLLRGFARP